MTPDEEERLIRKLKQRDEDAFRRVVVLYQHKVFSLVYRMLGDRAEAEDLSQEVFVAVFKNVDAFRGESSLATWIFRIATNHCHNRVKYLRRRAADRTQNLEDTREGDVHEGPLTRRSPTPEKIMAGRQLEAALQRALATLDEDHRTLIVLRDIESLSYQEIVEITGLNQGTVKSRLHRARIALKQEVERLYGND